MPETLLAEDMERRGDAVEHTFDVDVDHLVPIIDAQVVEGRHGHDTGIAEENVELAVSLASQLDEVGYIAAPLYVCGRVGNLAARRRDALGKRLEAVRTARTEHHLRAAFREQQ